MIDLSVRSLKNRDIFIYGAGTRGRIFAAHIAAKVGKLPLGFIVSDKMITAESTEIPGGAVLPISHFSDFKSSHADASKIAIINTVASSAIPELIRSIDEYLAASSGEPCIDVSAEDNYEIQIEMFDSMLRMRGLSVEDEVLDFDGVRIYNPLKVGHRYIMELLPTVFDLVWPTVYKDFSIINNGPYEFGNVVVRNGSNVIDVGANLGIFSCLMAARGCRVWSFEPDQDAIKVLQLQSDLYKGTISIIPKGLADTCKKLVFHRSKSTLHSSLFEARGSTNDIEMEVVSLDSELEAGSFPPPDFIKMNATGGEPDAIVGASGTLKKYRPTMTTSLATRKASEVIPVIESITDGYEFEEKWLKLFAEPIK